MTLRRINALSRAFSRSHQRSVSWGLMLCVVFVVGLFSGCGGKQNLFVLIPDPDGEVGSISVTNPQGTVTLERASQATEVKDETNAPDQPFTLEDQKIREVFGTVLEAQPAQPVRFLLYFLSGSTELDEDSKAEINRILDAIRQRQSADISIVGHSDTVGDEAYNYKLSVDRARAVSEVLMAEGVREEHLQVTSHGENNLLIQTEDNVEEARNRRVEVTVR